jgi:Asp-tRNA(Asn)/Glu-tRNA(Gln) amidotransferase A subunit family amidase
VYPASATPTLGHVGTLSRSVKDAAYLLDVIARYDPRDPASNPNSNENFMAAMELNVKGMRVAWSPTLGYAKPDLEVVKAAEATVSLLESAGANVELHEKVFLEDPIDLWNAEFYAGVGFKLRAVLEKSPEILDRAVLELLQGALYGQTVEDYFDTVFRRYAFRERFRQTLEPFDVLITPTLPVSSLEAGENIPKGHESHSIVSWVSYTYPFNLTGNPAVSVPCGTSFSGMPIGLQIIAKPHREIDALRVAAMIEALAPWQKNAVPVKV